MRLAQPMHPTVHEDPMRLADIWHWLTTSKYTRLLERENEELRAQLNDAKKQNELLTFALGRKPADPIEAVAIATEQAEETTRTAAATQMPARQRPGKRVGFSQVKKQLER